MNRGADKARALATSKTVFVANIPYDVTEEQLANLFSEVGPVEQFVLKFDPSTGRPKGFGFCHYYDHETALSAVRNLKDVHVSGRVLRVELSTDEPGNRRERDGRVGGGGGSNDGSVPGPGPGPGLGARGGPIPPVGVGMGMPSGMGGGPGAGGGRFGSSGPGGPGFAGGPPPPSGLGNNFPPPGMQGGPSNLAPNPGQGGFNRPNPGPGPGYGGPPPPTLHNGPGIGVGGGPSQVGGVNLSMLPVGQDVPVGEKATDVITKTLASIPPGKLEEVLIGMKTMVKENPDAAKAVFAQHPQLAYALFQAMLLMNIIDPSVLQRLQTIAKPLIPPPNAFQPSQSPFVPPPSASHVPPPPFAASTPYNNNNAPPNPYQNASRPPFGGSIPPPAPTLPTPYGARPPPMGGAPAPAYGGGYGGQGQAPPPPVAAPTGQGMNPNVASALALASEEQRAMLMQVLAMTQDQINALPPDQRASVMQLRQSIGA